jgi:3,4-dihydroxy 2-butanone 4-phosphate synthase/GTP cyclohydrolase II
VQTSWPTQLFMLTGTVERGDQRGRVLGFATANLALERSPETPAEGVYAGVAVTADGACHRAAVSVGRRPTFYAAGFELLEAHLLDFDGDIYDQPLEVRLHQRIRGQVRFDGIDALVAQLRADVAATRSLIDADLL